MTMKNKTAIALFLLLLLTAIPAEAGPLTGALAYVQNNVITDLETLAVIGLAIILLSMQIRWQFVLCICAAIWIMANPNTLTSAFLGG